MHFALAIVASYPSIVNLRRKEMGIRINMYYLSLDVFSEKSITLRNPYAEVNVPPRLEGAIVQIYLT